MYIYIYMCVYLYVCMFVCMYVCLFVCLLVCLMIRSKSMKGSWLGLGLWFILVGRGCIHAPLGGYAFIPLGSAWTFKVSKTMQIYLESIPLL